MKTISPGFAAHLAGDVTTVCTCWKVTRTDAAVYAFTDHDRDLVVSGVTYKASTGYTESNIVSNLTLDIDNLEIDGLISDDSITADDLRAGRWDYAEVRIFQVNWADLSQGIIYQRVGHLGEVTAKRNNFVAELRGLTQAYRRVIGELISPSCRAELGDARCKVDLGPFTVTGTIDGVSDDGLALYDAARAEAGPGGGVAITGISNAAAATVTLADGSLPLTQGQQVTISEVAGMVQMNALWVVQSVGAGGTSFTLAVDTSDTAAYPPYTSGGTVTMLGGASGYFDFGKITFSSGLNDGLSMEIKSYVEGQFTLQLPMPYQVAAGDTYSAVAGCDKALITCRDRFSNILNMRAEPFVPGEKVLLVGRRP